uniref:Putative secreted protein n=1 Tax=Psorophora albipes TaxID=869069 RepID=T1DG55_9DIPT
MQFSCFVLFSLCCGCECYLTTQKNNIGSHTNSRTFWWGEKSIKGPVFIYFLFSLLYIKLIYLLFFL